LRQGSWRSDALPIEWRLLEGDLLQRLAEAPLPDIIWYDPFSYKVDTQLWSVEVFERISTVVDGKVSRLYTYSASTAVRAAMLAAGWFVGRGISSGPKGETTVAYSSTAYKQGLTRELLDDLWLSRWGRSDAQQPIGAEGVDYTERVRNHRQFRVL
jgi:queuine tRNA-ribosyltransferase